MKATNMSEPIITRRLFAASTAGLLVAGNTAISAANQEPAKQDEGKSAEVPTEKKAEEAPFDRDYDAPSFKPSWKNKQINRMMAQDFVIFAHSDLDKVKMLYEREPGLLNATLDWGAGDWETALGGASHMGRHDIVKFLLSKGARIDLFCATMMGMLDTVKQMLEAEPALIDAKGPHGFTLHFHAQVGQEQSLAVLDYLQSVKQVELRPVPFLKPKDSKQDK